MFLVHYSHGQNSTLPPSLRIHDMAMPYSNSPGNYTIFEGGITQHRTPSTSYNYSICQGTRLGFERKCSASDKPYYVMIISYKANPTPYILGTSLNSNPDWQLFTFGQEGYKDLLTDDDFYIGFTTDAGMSSVSDPISNDIWYVKVDVEKGININTPTICPNQNTTLTATGCGLIYAQNTYDPSYPSLLAYWSTGAVGVDNITVNPISTTNYKFITKTFVVDFIPIPTSPASSVYLLSTTYQATVSVQTPIPPAIIGNNTMCDNNNVYAISNYQANQVYNISVSHGSASSVNANGEFTVTWQNFPNPGVATITVTATDNLNLGCTETTTIEVASCCEGSQSGDLDAPVKYVNASASQITAGSFTNANHQIVINGTFTIDQNFNITGCNHIKMAPNAEIIINPGKTLNIGNSRLAGDECNYMWKGIVVTDRTAHFNSYNGTFIEDAYNAVWAKQNAYVSVTASNFVNNEVSLKFTDTEPKPIGSPIAPIANTSYVYGNQFYSTGNFKPPFAATYKGASAIYTNNITDLHIGDNNQNQNVFNAIGSAVYAENTYMHLVNNLIKNTEGSAVYFRNMAVAQNGFYVYAVYARMHVENNIFQGNMPHAIYGFGRIEAKNNTFKNRNANSPTIWVREVARDSYVNNNTFSPINNNTGVNVTVPAVKLERAAAPYLGMKLTVNNNTIHRYRSGIELTNTQAYIGTQPDLLTRKINVKNNTVNNADNGTATKRVYGIRLQHANGANVEDNAAKRLGGITTTSYGRTTTERGIAISQTQNAQIINNDIETYGNGIWGAGVLRGTYFGCNISTANYYGFYFLPPSPKANTILSHQGTPTKPPKTVG